jgi:hypothetical protein
LKSGKEDERRIVMPNYDLSNLALQIAAPANVLMYDDLGDPSVMVAIPKFKISEVITGGSDSTHPAFIVNGVEKDVIYISKYLNIVNNGRAYSLPMQDPTGAITFDTAWQYCKAKGAGWHLMTTAESAAVALWCKKNGFMPKGNNNYGKDTADTALPQKALATSYGTDGRINRTATGSGPVSWYHDNTEAGITDLNGNAWEWNSGMRLQDGEIQILPNNDAADWNNPVNAASTLWKAILQDGTLVAPGTTGTLKWDWLNSKITLSTTNTVSGTQRSTTFETLGVDTSVTTVPEILKALALHPAETGYNSDGVSMNNSGEHMPLRGGAWSSGVGAGVFALNLFFARSPSSPPALGFRHAFCAL